MKQMNYYSYPRRYTTNKKKIRLLNKLILHVKKENIPPFNWLDWYIENKDKIKATKKEHEYIYTFCDQVKYKNVYSMINYLRHHYPLGDANFNSFLQGHSEDLYKRFRLTTAEERRRVVEILNRDFNCAYSTECFDVFEPFVDTELTKL